MNQSTLDDCKIIKLSTIADPKGKLTFVEGGKDIPFKIERVFYIFDIPTAEKRGAHANKELQELVICLSGSLDITLDDGRKKSTFHLNRPWEGLFIPPMMWSSIENFDPGTVYLVLASTKYDPHSYIRNYDSFLKEKL